MIQLLRAMVLLFGACSGLAAEAPDRHSPWLAVPLVSSDPKVGTSFGGMLGYLHQFDADSPSSMFGLSAKYSTTDSYTAGLFAKAYFGEDRHRVTAGVATGRIRNDYEDFQGSGLPAQTTDDLRFAAVRYLRRLGSNWFAGAQFLATNYLIHGEDAATQSNLEIMGLTGFDANGLGLVVHFDTRDNQRSPTRGQLLMLSSLAYRKSLGGDESFDAYQAKYRRYVPHGHGHVLGYRLETRITDDAPESAYSSPNLRGYVRGNYLAPHSITAEVEERHRLSDRWSVAVFAGANCLLDALSDCGDSDAWYPEAGGGVIFDVKPEEGVVLRLDYAQGKSGNNGLYLTLGQPF